MDLAAHGNYLARKYFPELDGLRALAVLLVVNVHLYDGNANWSWLAGQRGVILFFVLSGFLITTLALREEAARGRLSLGAFYVRRALRIFPLYYLTLALYCLLILHLGVSPHLRLPFAESLPSFLGYLQELPFCRRALAGAPECPFGHSWTLGVEEKFYLLWPLLAFVAWRGVPTRRIWGTALLAALLLLVPLALSPLGPVARVVGRMLYCYGTLLCGCSLAFLLHDPSWFARLRRLAEAGGTAGVLLALLGAHFISPWVHGPWSEAVNALYALCATGLLACLLVVESGLSRGLRWRPLVFVGRVSYGIYLIHILCMAAAYKLIPTDHLGWAGSLLAFLLTCVLSTLGAWGLQVTIESHFIALGRRWSKRIQEAAASQPASPRRQAAPAEATSAETAETCLVS